MNYDNDSFVFRTVNVRKSLVEHADKPFGQFTFQRTKVAPVLLTDGLDRAIVHAGPVVAVMTVSFGSSHVTFVVIHDPPDAVVALTTVVVMMASHNFLTFVVIVDVGFDVVATGVSVSASAGRADF
jgi:hypothetical protein